jgi:hypothetical protein
MEAQGVRGSLIRKSAARGARGEAMARPFRSASPGGGSGGSTRPDFAGTSSPVAGAADGARVPSRPSVTDGNANRHPRLALAIRLIIIRESRRLQVRVPVLPRRCRRLPQRSRCPWHRSPSRRGRGAPSLALPRSRPASPGNPCSQRSPRARRCHSYSVELPISPVTRSAIRANARNSCTAGGSTPTASRLQAAYIRSAREDSELSSLSTSTQ